MKVWLAGVVVPLGAVCLQPACAQPLDVAYPSKPIRMIVPLPPGGSVDPTARMLAARVGPRLKQQVVVENMPGGSGVIGAETVARAAADGYTLLFATPTIVVTGPLINKKVPYQPLRDFDPVSLVVSNPFVIVVPSSLPVNSTGDLIALAKRKPGALMFGTSGEGTPQHIAVEMFMSLAGIEMLHVPYKGGGQVQVDLLGGRIQVYASSIIGVGQHVKNGKLKAIAVTTARRAAAMPSVPTLAESGVPGYEFDTWYAVFAPAKTPATIIGRLNSEIVAVLSDPELVKSMAEQGSDIRSSTPAALGTIVKTETERLGRLVEKIGLVER
jgi:tripartite-type tricarboxylate transporter receptor subunit TctC